MGETNKQVRVDNWGIFFLQRLQLFFNRTDYCDLTLQFEGNVQLKVHRLVMNACTEYFNILEQTCEVVDGNTIIMPDDLQADVILPIVNFMYTGMLEFQMSLFDRLYRTAEVMNIPILTKLLDAQKKPIPPLPKSQNKKMQPTWNLHGKKITPKVENDLPATLPGRKLPVWKRKTVPTVPPPTTTQQYYPEPKKVPQDPLALFDNTPKPTRFEWPEDEINSTFNLMENSFDDISYTSKPLLTQSDELRASTSFDDMKYTSSINKRSSKDYNQSIDMEEVKSYVKEQKIRSDLTEYDDDDDPDNYLESIDIDKDNNKRKATKLLSPVHTKKVRFSVNEKENKEAKINVTTSGKSPEMDHTKIISEVLKKYPHLVKKNKNIRLKILAKSPTKSDLAKGTGVKTSTSKVKVHVASPKGSPRVTKVNTMDLAKNQDEGPWVCNKCSSNEEQVEFVLYYLYRKHMTDVHHEKFDSRMCKFCGHQSSKHNLLMYHQYTRHGIKPPPAYNFPKCNRCPYIALTENLLIKHKLNHTKFDLQCIECKVAFNNQNSLSSHMQITGHTGKTGRHNYDCQYCTKRYHSGSNLFSHIKMVHRDEARRDGIVSIDEKDEVDEDQLEEDTEEYILPKDEDQKEKIKILSDIKVAATTGESVSQTTIETGTTTTAETHERVATTTSGIQNVTGGIATSLGLVDIVVLDENQQYILHNDQQLVTQQTLANEQREYIIPEMTEQHRFAQAQNINEVITSEHNVITQSILNNSDIASTDELVMVLTDHDYNDGNNEILSSENSNIVVLYSHPVDGQQNQFITSQGNLMLNSQTGMLEIRNTEPNSMDSNQDTQIESIEMIQREINSHNIITSSHKETTVPTSSSFAESLPQDTVILESQFSNENLIENQQEATDEAPAEDIDVDRMIAINEKPIEQNIDQEISGHVLVLNDCLSNQEEEPMEIDEECSIQDHQNENQTSMIQEDLTPKAQEIVPAEIQEQVSSKSMPEIGDTIETTVSLTEGISEVSSHPTIQEENQNGDGITTAAIDLESNIDKLDRQHDVTSKDLTSENIEPTEMTSDTHMSDSQTVEHNEEIQVREVEDVVSQEEVNPSISEPVVVETNDLQQVDTEEQLDNDQLMKEQISDDSTAVTNEAQTVELQKIEVQNESIVRENSDNLVHVGADHATGSSEEHIDNLVEHKITQNQDLPMENVEIQEETQQVEQIMQREETTETAEIIAESKKDIQDEQMEQVTEIEKDTNKTEESTCQTEDQSNQVIETHEEQTQSQVEESQVEAPQIEESQVEAPQIEESQIEDSQIEEPHLAESHLEESHIEDSHLEESHLDNSHLEESHLEESHLEESHLEESHLEESHLEESHLEESHLEESHLKESQLEESQMEESQLEEPQIEDTDSYMEINLQTEEVSSQMDDTPSQIDENSVQNESADDAYKEDEKFEEEVSQADEKSNPEEQLIEEGTSSVDENSQSQDSQISHCSSRQEALISEYKKSTSQETKISILNDWEDTEDSQQSDNVSKKAELTVNKLIHDWDDDDEEGHESDS